MNRLEAIKRRRVMEGSISYSPPGIFLEYIQSTGTQYIDTLKPIKNVEYDIKIDLNVGERRLYDAPEFVGSERTVSRQFATCINWGAVSSQGVFLWRGNYYGEGGTVVEIPQSEIANKRVVIETIGLEWYFNGILRASQPNVDIIENENNFRLFCDSRNRPTNTSDIKLYSYELKHNSKVIQQLLPFLHQDGRIGLWDTINNVFHPNMGTGEFVAGHVVDDDFWELEYIESNGNQWLDTELKGEYNSVIDITFSNTSQLYANIMGSRKAAYEEDLTLIMENASLLTDFGGNSANRCKYGYSADKYNVILNQNGSHYCNDVKYFDIPYPPNEGFITHHSLLLFDVYGNYQQIPYAGKVYYYKHSLGDNLIQHLIPVQKKISGEVCMYDLVSKKFFSNQGTGEFIAGPIVDDDFVELEYIESTGTQWIDTGMKLNPDDVNFVVKPAE